MIGHVKVTTCKPEYYKHTQWIFLTTITIHGITKQCAYKADRCQT
jgi:leucyl-tRNA synthetase